MAEASPLRFISYGSTTIGRTRAKNEDSFLRDDHLRLYVVADGVGGQPAGEIASAVVVRALGEFFKHHKPATGEDAVRTMRQALDASCHAVLDRSHTDITCRGMATTLTACWFGERKAVFAHVGDSQAFLLRGSRIRQITEDHTVAGELRGRGVGGHHPAMRTVFAHMLTQSVGPEMPVEPQVCEISIRRGDILLLCSDGVTRQTMLSELSHVLRLNESPERAVEELIRLADERGGLDNATAVIIKVI
ncbi:MAG: serine/threonine-protein phosphatase [Verrucomicrobia bacterium]|nr:serine/threonine-protein phosphatase [Verrucomicrobiota bacterium]